MLPAGTVPRVIPLLALRGLVVFPGMEVTLQIGRRRSVSAVQEALSGDGLLAVVAQRNPAVEDPGAEDLFGMGTVVQLKQVEREPAGVLSVTVEGRARVAIVRIVATEPHFRIVGEVVEERAPDGSIEVEAMARALAERYEQFVRLSRRLRGDAVPLAVAPEVPGRLADLVAGHLPVRLEDRQAILEAVSVKERLEKLSRLLHRETELLELEKKIQDRVKRQVEKTQREYYLREQMKAIQKELGDEDVQRSEAEEFRARVRECRMPAEVEEKALREVARLEKMPPQAAEAVVVRNYVDWLTSLPWSVTTEDRLDLETARKVLDEDHYGLEKVKERMLEFLAVRKLVQTLKGPILCLVGPPGVGKTSLARSVARALDRKFVRVSLGGVRDEAEIRGHRRTYVGALPGRIIQGIRQAGSRNPVFLLDEIDKMSADFRGDPAAALLEVLDPEHNATFSDHYLEVPFDLSQVLFITTANSLYNIPRPLLDRMETIYLSGYTEEEKVRIARRHLVPKQIEAHGLTDRQVTLSDESLRMLVRRYTREAGVRQLERELAAVLRKMARRAAEGEGAGGKRFKVSVSDLGRLLGPAPYRYGLAEAESQVGVSTGIGWTEYGGDIMSIEVGLMPGKGGLYLTGKLGEVMRESAQAGLSFVRSRAEELGIDAGFNERYDIHVHIPEGAVPKDGPSAGITMATAIVSALTGRPVRRDVAMTGEITLRGRVLPVGGVKEKVLAAHRAGITTVILPEENRKDVEEVPANVRRHLKLIYVNHMNQVLAAALAEAASQSEAGAGPLSVYSEMPLPAAMEHLPGGSRSGAVPSGPGAD